MSARRSGRGQREELSELVEPARRGATCWPALERETSSVLMLRTTADDAASDGRVVVTRGYVGAGRAPIVFEWMCQRPGDWPLWGRIACLFGDAALLAMVVEPAERDAEMAVIRAEETRLAAEEQARLHRQIDLYILNEKNRRPGLSLENGDATHPFFVMRFSEKWERERVLDWLRWQKGRFLEFRELFDAEGAEALERVIIAGMRQTEAEIKARGLSSGGRRPLRFWRGE